MRQTWRSERMKKTPTAAIAAGSETLYRYRAKSKDSAPAASAPGEAVGAAIGVDNLRQKSALPKCDRLVQIAETPGWLETGRRANDGKKRLLAERTQKEWKRNLP